MNRPSCAQREGLLLPSCSCYQIFSKTIPTPFSAHCGSLICSQWPLRSLFFRRAQPCGPLLHPVPSLKSCCPETLVGRDLWSLAGLSPHAGRASSVLSPFDCPIDLLCHHFILPSSILHTVCQIWFVRIALESNISTALVNSLLLVWAEVYCMLCSPKSSVKASNRARAVPYKGTTMHLSISLRTALTQGHFTHPAAPLWVLTRPHSFLRQSILLWKTTALFAVGRITGWIISGETDFLLTTLSFIVWESCFGLLFNLNYMFSFLGKNFCFCLP